ncbi:hypothetical protein CASFOL_035188 [Castilleja foliolosa]|uniref:Uncharacterized protein n=1 Tax=Castilleja foliolosa TaxID=1961234 RepID=A0ABD3BTI6_9LAMI
MVYKTPYPKGIRTPDLSLTPTCRRDSGTTRPPWSWFFCS